MDQFALQSAKIVGSPKENSGCWIHAFTTPGPEKALARGQLFGILKLANLASEEEVAAAGKELISRFHEEYYGDLSETALLRLKQTVAKVGAEFKAEIVALAIMKDVFYVVISGEGRLVFGRGGQIFNLLVGTGERIKTGSGYLKDNDHFLLGSQEFFKLVAQGTIQAALAAGSPEQAAEALAPIIHGQARLGSASQGNGSGAAALIIKVEEKITRPVVGEAVVERKRGLILETACLAADTARKKISSMKDDCQRWLKSRLAAFMEKARAKGRVKRSPKTLITVALVLLFILGVSVILGAKQRRQLGATKETQSLLMEAKSKSNEAQQLLVLNPEKARQLLLEAQNLSQQIEATGDKTGEFEKFKAELTAALKSAIREYAVQGTLFLDLALIKAGAAGSDWVASPEQLFILDQNLSTIYTLGANDKKSAILASGQDLTGSQKITVGSTAADVLTEKGIVEINLKVKSSKLIVPRDSAWGEVADMEIFGDNLYLLDKGGEIWKYPASGQKQRWLKEKVDLSQAVAMAIDGSIWVLKNNGEILKLVQGQKSDFKIKNLTKSFSQPRTLLTSSESEFLYVLDSGNSRIVILKKTGEYEKEFSWSEMKNATSLAVFEKNSQIFLLSGSKVFQISLK